ncbi:MAG: response regulator transcription factor [Chloroflexota bacterium]|nr:response regulator transcription factor [Chloroflexota bacterium]MDE3102343.1 response regulator transcription factor [Chloroflexota bacterium]
MSAKGPILIVEDDPSIRQLLRDALEQEGFEPVAACDGAEAIAISDHQRPAAVVLDMGLPLIDGASVADRIRDRHGDVVPFIVVTASRRIEEAASRIRAARYLAKPFDIADLISAVRSALELPPDTAREPATSPFF